MARFTVRDLKAQLKSYTQEALVGEIADIYRKFPAVEDYLTSKFTPDSMLSMHERFLVHAEKHGLVEAFRKRARAVVDDTDGIGWGFNDAPSDMYEEWGRKGRQLAISGSFVYTVCRK